MPEPKILSREDVLQRLQYKPKMLSREEVLQQLGGQIEGQPALSPGGVTANPDVPIYRTIDDQRPDFISIQDRMAMGFNSPQEQVEYFKNKYPQEEFALDNQDLIVKGKDPYVWHRADPNGLVGNGEFAREVAQAFPQMFNIAAETAGDIATTGGKIGAVVTANPMPLVAGTAISGALGMGAEAATQTVGQLLGVRDDYNGQSILDQGVNSAMLPGFIAGGRTATQVGNNVVNFAAEQIKKSIDLGGKALGGLRGWSDKKISDYIGRHGDMLALGRALGVRWKNFSSVEDMLRRVETKTNLFDKQSFDIIEHADNMSSLKNDLGEQLGEVYKKIDEKLQWNVQGSKDLASSAMPQHAGIPTEIMMSWLDNYKKNKVSKISDTKIDDLYSRAVEDVKLNIQKGKSWSFSEIHNKRKQADYHFDGFGNKAKGQNVIESADEFNFKFAKTEIYRDMLQDMLDKASQAGPTKELFQEAMEESVGLLQGRIKGITPTRNGLREANQLFGDLADISVMANDVKNKKILGANTSQNWAFYSNNILRGVQAYQATSKLPAMHFAKHYMQREGFSNVAASNVGKMIDAYTPSAIPRNLNKLRGTFNGTMQFVLDITNRPKMMEFIQSTATQGMATRGANQAVDHQEYVNDFVDMFISAPEAQAEQILVRLMEVDPEAFEKPSSGYTSELNGVPMSPVEREMEQVSIRKQLRSGSINSIEAYKRQKQISLP